MANKKIALITGITGQDGSYLAELLLEKGYEVHGIVRRASVVNTKNIDHIFSPEGRGLLHYGDLTDGNSLREIIYKVKPDEIYNLGAMSHVAISFHIPEYTLDTVALGPIRILETIKQGVTQGILSKNIKFYQASSSEMFGTTAPPQNELSSMQPVSPYGVSKLLAYHATKLYRTGYNLFACTGILFNHESPRRGINFVTRKITRGAARIKLGLQDKLELGNLDSLRDWGHAKDYVRAIYMIMQHSEADEFIVATKHQYTVKEFVKLVFDYFNLDWQKHVIILDELKRPNEVPSLLGDPTKIQTKLGWSPIYDINMIVKEMCESDYNEELRKIKNGN